MMVLVNKATGAITLGPTALRMERKAAAFLANTAARELHAISRAAGGKTPKGFAREPRLTVKLAMMESVRAELEALGPAVAAAVEKFVARVETYKEAKAAYASVKDAYEEAIESEDTDGAIPATL